MMFNVLGAVAVLASSTIGGLLSYGTYGALRDRGMGPWGAGAATGAITGGIGALMMLVFGGTLQAKIMEAQQLQGVFAEPVSGISTPMVITGLTMSKLSGMPIKVNGMGLEDLQLGGYAVDPRTMQLMQ